MTKKRKEPDREAKLRRELENQSLRREPVASAISVETPENLALARTYLPESFLVMLFCLTPVALPAIYYGFLVRQASQAGDQDKTEAASEMARIWFIFSVCFGVTANIAILGVYLVSQKI
jgi:hypothetical protein